MIFMKIRDLDFKQLTSYPPNWLNKQVTVHTFSPYAQIFFFFWDQSFIKNKKRALKIITYVFQWQNIALLIIFILVVFGYAPCRSC